MAVCSLLIGCKHRPEGCGQNWKLFSEWENKLVYLCLSSRWHNNKTCWIFMTSLLAPAGPHFSKIYCSFFHLVFCFTKCTKKMNFSSISLIMYVNVLLSSWQTNIHFSCFNLSYYYGDVLLHTSDEWMKLQSFKLCRRPTPLILIILFSHLSNKSPRSLRVIKSVKLEVLH